MHLRFRYILRNLRWLNKSPWRHCVFNFDIEKHAWKGLGIRTRLLASSPGPFPVFNGPGDEATRLRGHYGTEWHTVMGTSIIMEV